MRPTEDLVRVLEEHLTGHRQLDLAGRAREELAAELGLDDPDLRGQGRLRDVWPLRRSREVQLFGDGDEVAQMPKLDLRAPSGYAAG